MYICPICNRSFEIEEMASKHYLKCWKEKYPYHQSKSAPQSAAINIREINNDILNFFNSFQKE